MIATPGLFDILKLVILLTTVALTVLFNWYTSRAYFTFRNHCCSHILVFAYGTAIILIGAVAPFFGIAYLGLWAFNWLPSHVGGYFTAAAEILWSLASLSIIVRHSAKYWTNRCPNRIL
jgi:hypothetical protein